MVVKASGPGPASPEGVNLDPLAPPGDATFRIGELSRASGVAVGTIKFYVREGLVPPGEVTSKTRAVYRSAHLRRLRLVRVLAEVGGLSLARIKEIVAGIEAAERGDADALEVSRLTSYALIGRTNDAVRTATDEAQFVAAREATDAFVAQLGLLAADDAPARDALAEALAAVRALGIGHDPAVFAEHARLAIELGRLEAAATASSDDPTTVVHSITVGSVVWGAAFMALRSLAQEDATRRLREG